MQQCNLGCIGSLFRKNLVTHTLGAAWEREAQTVKSSSSIAELSSFRPVHHDTTGVQSLSPLELASIHQSPLYMGPELRLCDSPPSGQTPHRTVPSLYPRQKCGKAHTIRCRSTNWNSRSATLNIPPRRRTSITSIRNAIVRSRKTSFIIRPACRRPRYLCDASWWRNFAA